MSSDLFKLNLGDIWRGLVVAVIAAVLVSVQTIFNEKGLGWSIEDLKTILNVVIASGLGYIIKNFLTDSQGKILGKY